jgi:tetratricopeptide (TPR) repeat protein
MKLPLNLRIAVLALLFTTLGRAQGEALFDQATEAYNQGEYDKAISLYQEILRGGQHSAALYFNLGNAHYKNNEIAPSIYYYEKALLLEPGDPEILNNLGFARNMTLDAISPIPKTDLQRFYERVVFALTTDQWAYLGIFLVILFVAGYLLFLIFGTPNRKRIALLGSLAALGLGLLSTALSYLQLRAYQQDQPAIVFARELTVRSEPNPDSPEAFLLHEGTRVQVDDSLGQWRKIRLADGQIGWAPSGSVRLLKDF